MSHLITWVGYLEDFCPDTSAPEKKIKNVAIMNFYPSSFHKVLINNDCKDKNNTGNLFRQILRKLT